MVFLPVPEPVNHALDYLPVFRAEVFLRHGDDWAVKKGGAGRASSVHRTQGQAEQAAKETVRNLGGGEVRIQGRDGQWRDSDTVAPGNDPVPPRDKKH